LVLRYQKAVKGATQTTSPGNGGCEMPREWRLRVAPVMAAVRCPC